jgi:hypothetical protein
MTVLHAQTSTLATVEENGTRGTRLNLVFLSEGYTSAQMGTFANDVDAAVTFLFTREPWSRYRSYCNIYRIEIASNQSGTDNGQAGGLKDTYFQTGFNTPGIPQLNTLAGSGSSRAYSLLNKHVPEYDIPIILINDPKYGGSGGPLALTTTDPSSAGILEHELGHSFAKLTDEYDEEYPGYPNTEYPNATAKTVLDQIRWKVWIESGTPVPRTPEYDPLYNDKVGHFEGANYHRSGWFRPHDAALMRFLNTPPGSVTREAILLTYYSKISPIDSITPTALTQTFTAPAPLTLSITPKVPSTLPALTVEWRHNDVPIDGETGNSLSINTKELGNGTHKIKAVVRDPTDWVRRDPTALVVEEVTWTLKLSNQVDPPVITSPLPPGPLTLATSSEGGLLLDATATGPEEITYEWLKDNRPLKPAVTTPVLNINPRSITHGGTYTVKVKTASHTVTDSVVVVVYDNMTSLKPIVVGAGKTATLSFGASANLPAAVNWNFGENPALTNDGRISGAQTNKLIIKQITPADAGGYFYTPPGSSQQGPIDLIVVTTKPDYAGVDLTLPSGHVGGNYSASFTLPANVLQRPNSFSARLPAGLKMDTRTGIITGVPTTATKDQTLGDEISFTVGNEFGKVTLKARMLIRPLPVSLAGVYSGIILRGSPLGGSTGGRLDFTVQSTGSFSGKAIIGAETLSFTSSLFISSPDPNAAVGSIRLKPRHLSSPVDFYLLFNDGGDADPLTAQARGTTESTTECMVWRNRWLSPAATHPYIGYYTYALSTPTSSGAPKGRGYGSLKVDIKGTTILAGRLADGESFTCTSHLNHELKAPLYQTLYTSTEKGSIVGLIGLDFTSLAPQEAISATSFLDWRRPQDTRPSARVYKSGFGPLTMGAEGARYTVPAKTELPMGLSAPTGSPLNNAHLFFDTTLGSDPLAVNADVTLNIKASGATTVNTPNPKTVTFSMVPSTGAFKGTYTTKDNDPRPPVPPAVSRPLITRKVDFQGMVVTEQNTVTTAHGFFLRDALPLADGSTTPANSPKDSGAVEIINAIFAP